MLQRRAGWLAVVLAILALSNSPGTATDRSHAGGDREASRRDDRRAAFAVIEQPLGVKLGAIAGGIALASLELWWFLGRHRQDE